MKKIFISTLACELRLLDAKRVSDYFCRNNYIITNKPSNADIILFFGCAVIDKLAKNSLEKIKELQEYDAELIVAGCTPGIDGEKLSEIFSGRTISTKDLDKIDDLFPENKIKFNSIKDSNTIFHSNVECNDYGFAGRMINRVNWIKEAKVKVNNYFLKNFYNFDEDNFLYKSLPDPKYYIRTSWGCLGSCSYCAVKKGIGKLKSKPKNQCLIEFKKGLKEGYNSFILSGDDVGGYGLDIGLTLPFLLNEMTKIPGEYKIGIREISPRWIVPYINDFGEIINKCKIVNMGISLQSGNSRILKLMNRFSDVSKVKNSLINLKKICPDLILSAQCIVGFPSETEDEYKQTLYFIKELDFDLGYLIPFSIRTDTKAENIEPKICENEILNRMKYARKFLHNEGYIIKNSSLKDIFLFEKKI